MTTEQNTHKLPAVWNYVNKDYDIKDIIGKGSYGLVVKAEDRKTKKMYAIKHIDEVFITSYHSKKVTREVLIMAYLSSIKGNVYTAKLHDIIIPPAETKDGLDFDCLFLVQEYCGMDIKQLIDSGKVSKLT